MTKRICACLLGAFVLVSCQKKPSQDAGGTISADAGKPVASVCAKEIISEQSLKVGGTGIVLPPKSKLCFSEGNLEIQVELPEGYGFIVKGESKSLPVFATYSCTCSGSGSACKVFYADGLGFGCLQSTCTGSCTGKFTYKGYTVERVISTTSREAFFSDPDIQKLIAGIHSTGDYSGHDVYGVPFFIVHDEKKFLALAKCDCEGTTACRLITISIPGGPKIYFCEGSCNGCELTVS